MVISFLVVVQPGQDVEEVGGEESMAAIRRGAKTVTLSGWLPILPL
jgi:hypothetical protein